MKNNTRRLLAALLAVVMLAALCVPALALDALDYDGDEVTFIKADGSGFGMFTAQEGTTCAIDGDDVVIHYVPKNKTVYNGIHWGAIDDAELTKDVAFNEDGTFDIILPKTDCGKAVPVAPVKASDGATTKDQYYLAIPAEGKITPAGGATEEPVDIAAPSGEAVELTITNNLNMFKAVSASLVTDGENGEFIVFALSGSGYKYVFKGTYEQAVENGDAIDNWIAATENAAGKLEFRVPVAPDETLVPVVAISNSKYEGYLAGENTLERAFYPRQLTLDREAKTLVTDDYKASAELAVTNNVKMFKVAGATLDTVGGPNSNGYKTTLVLTMGSDSFDGAYVGRAAEIAEGTETIAVAERVFELPVRWVAEAGKPESIVNKLAAPFVVSFHSVKNDAWYERLFTVSEKDGTLVIDEVPAVTFTDVPDGQYYTEAVAWAVDKGVTTGATETEFKPDDPCTRGQVVTFLWRAAGKPAAEGTNPFTDVAEGAFYYDAVLWAVASGVTTGVSETEFKPDEPCTRDQVVTFLWRAAGKPAAEGSASFTDVAEGSFYAEAVAWAVANGVTTGYNDTTFAPGDPCTRGQVVTFLWRAAK
jgi:hypothetical protein